MYRSYRDMILRTPGLLAYWPLDVEYNFGELVNLDPGPRGFDGTAQGGLANPVDGGPLLYDASGYADFPGGGQYLSTAWVTRRNLVPTPRLQSQGSPNQVWAPFANTPTYDSADLVAPMTGAKVVKAVATGANAVQLFPAVAGNWGGLAASGDVFSASVYLAAATGNAADRTGRVAIRYWDAAGNIISTTTAGSVTVPRGGGWTLVKLENQTAPANTARVGLVIAFTSTTPAASEVFYATAPILERGATVGAYFDGANGGADANYEGAAEQSISGKGPFVNGSAWTFEGWAWQDTTATTMVLLGGSISGSAPRLQINAGSANVQWRTQHGDSSSASQVQWTGSWPGTGQWVHWALVVNLSADTISLYINGSLVATGSGLTADYSDLNALRLGAFVAGTSPLDGRLAQIAVYSRALTQSEIRSRVLLGKAGAA